MSDMSQKKSSSQRRHAHLDERRSSREEARAAGDLKGQKVRRSTEKLLTRTTSGAIYAIITLACVLVGPITTTLLITAEAWLCCSEFFRICRMGGRYPNDVLGLAAALVFPAAAYFHGLVACAFVVIFLLMVSACWYVFTPRANVADVAVTAFGPIYTSFAFASIVLLRKIDPGMQGALVTLGIMFSIWANDAFAYFVGSAVGSHKLAPKISPNKSVEGFVGGLVGSVLIWVLLAAFVITDLPLPLAAVFGIVVGIVSVIGDLFESRLKRGVGVKDSGNVIPGHGGLLDRSDSMLFGSTAALLLLFVGGFL